MMVSGERVTSKMQEYAVTARELLTRDQIYSAMVIYRLLTYENGEVFIPNRELMDKFNELLLSNESLGYVHRLAKESTKMLNATLCKDTETMSEILEYAHNTKSPIFSYNSATELTAVVNLIYLAARDKYHIEREDKTGKGYVDFIFYPVKPASDGIILELKDKLNLEDAFGGRSEEGETMPVSAANTVKNEAVQALTALGYSSSEALSALAKVEISEDTDVESVLKAALKQMAFL